MNAPRRKLKKIAPAMQRDLSQSDSKNGLTGFLTSEKAFIAAAISALLCFAIENGVFHVIDSPIVLTVLFTWLFVVMIFGALGVVRHAESVAHRVGEPFGTLLLTLAAVSLEVLMVTIVILHTDSGYEGHTDVGDSFVARDMVFAVLMIVINGLVGVCLITGGFKYGDQKYNMKSSKSFFSMIVCLTGIGMFIPMFLPADFQGTYLIFQIIAMLLVYGVFLRTQAVENRQYFIYSNSQEEHEEEVLSKRDQRMSTAYHTFMLIATLAIVLYLSESLARVIDEGVDLLRLPQALGAMVLAILVLSPEALTAIRAGRRNDMQRVVNISLGSALSSLALTIPVISIVSFFISGDVVWALTPLQAILLLVTLGVGMNTYKDGETNVLQGVIHLIVFAAFIVLIFN